MINTITLISSGAIFTAHYAITLSNNIHTWTKQLQDRVRALVSFVGSLIAKSNKSGDDGNPRATSNVPKWDEPVAFAEAMAVMSKIHENKLLLPGRIIEHCVT